MDLRRLDRRRTGRGVGVRSLRLNTGKLRHLSSITPSATGRGAEQREREGCSIEKTATNGEWRRESADHGLSLTRLPLGSSTAMPRPRQLGQIADASAVYLRQNAAHQTDWPQQFAVQGEAVAVQVSVAVLTL